jgi:translocator protein
MKRYQHVMQIVSRTLIPPLSPRSMVFLGIAILIVATAAVSGSSVTAPKIMTWYAGIRKPWFNPPSWIFPVVWPLLYGLMAFGLWRILRQVGGGQPRKVAIFAFMIQIILNAAWSFAFFGAQSPAAGLVVIVALLLAIIFMVLKFHRADPLSAWLQLPYLSWVTFAAILNTAIWRLN